MATEHFCLRWNNHQSTLVSVFDNLLESGTLVDCTLAADGRYLKAHKVVLSACSPYLGMLLSQHYDKHPIIILKDVKFEELKAMLDYMYRGEVNISQEQLSSFLKAAETLQIKGLTDTGGEDGNGLQPNRPPSSNSTTSVPNDDPQSPVPSGEGESSPGPRKRKRNKYNDEQETEIQAKVCVSEGGDRLSRDGSSGAVSSVNISSPGAMKSASFGNVKPEPTDIDGDGQISVDESSDSTVVSRPGPSNGGGSNNKGSPWVLSADSSGEEMQLTPGQDGVKVSSEDLIKNEVRDQESSIKKERDDLPDWKEDSNSVEIILDSQDQAKGNPGNDGANKDNQASGSFNKSVTIYNDSGEDEIIIPDTWVPPGIIRIISPDHLKSIGKKIVATATHDNPTNLNLPEGVNENWKNKNKGPKIIPHSESSVIAKHQLVNVKCRLVPTQIPKILPISQDITQPGCYSLGPISNHSLQPPVSDVSDFVTKTVDTEISKGNLHITDSKKVDHHLSKFRKILPVPTTSANTDCQKNITMSKQVTPLQTSTNSNQLEQSAVNHQQLFHISNDPSQPANSQGIFINQQVRQCLMNLNNSNQSVNQNVLINQKENTLQYSNYFSQSNNNQSVLPNQEAKQTFQISNNPSQKTNNQCVLINKEGHIIQLSTSHKQSVSSQSVLQVQSTSISNQNIVQLQPNSANNQSVLLKEQGQPPMQFCSSSSIVRTSQGHVLINQQGQPCTVTQPVFVTSNIVPENSTNLISSSMVPNMSIKDPIPQIYSSALIKALPDNNSFPFFYLKK